MKRIPEIMKMTYSFNTSIKSRIRAFDVAAACCSLELLSELEMPLVRTTLASSSRFRFVGCMDVEEVSEFWGALITPFVDAILRLANSCDGV